MGIRGLYTKLKAYGTTVTFDGRSNKYASEEGGLVIDGPAFFYWAWQETVLHVKTGPLQIPTNAALASHALTLLKTLNHLVLPM